MYKYGINACMVVVLSINEIDLNITNLPKTSKKKNQCMHLCRIQACSSSSCPFPYEINTHSKY